jgi:hypothetical protein
MHQQHLMKFIKQILPQYSRGQSKLIFKKNFDEQYQRNLVECLGRMELLFHEIDPIIANCARVTAERQEIETKINEFRAQVSKIKELSNNSAKLLESLHQILVNMHKILDEIKLKSVTGPKLISLDSTYTWKVNISLLINNVQAIQSEAIHTSKSGYKLMLSCEIYVDAQKQKRYISISLILLRGEFDAILPWPMVFPITLSIIDLTTAKKHISHPIPCDSRISAFNKPTGDANIPFRIAQFCAVDTLLENGNNYIQDGFIFIQMYLDFTAPSANPIPNKGLSKPIEDVIQRNILSNMS